MTPQEFELLVENYPLAVLVGVILLSILGFLIARFIIGQALTYIASKTKNIYDDILVEHLKPFRVAWVAPALIIYFFAYLLPEYQTGIEKISLFFVLWITALTVMSLLNAVNTIYEASPSYSGVSIQGYLDLVKLLLTIIGIILSISLLTGESPLVLLTGLGAVTAILLLVFRDTILAIVASVQIAANDLIKEGDWIEVPSYEADGDVLNISLHTVKIQNWDKTYSIIPTYKMVEVPYKNWRGMQESGGRRIKRSLIIDMNTLKFCDEQMLNRLSKVDLIKEQINEIISNLDEFKRTHADQYDSPLDGPQVTNAEIFRIYIENYMRSREDIHQENLTLLVRSLSPSEHGLPIEVYAFTKTTAWDLYEKIQAEIFDHLIAAANIFDLNVFQQPTGLDFSAGLKLQR